MSHSDIQCSRFDMQPHVDPENKTWLGQSWFGLNWRKLMDYNSMFSAFFLNGGLLGMMLVL